MKSCSAKQEAKNYKLGDVKWYGTLKGEVSLYS